MFGDSDAFTNKNVSSSLYKNVVLLIIKNQRTNLVFHFCEKEQRVVHFVSWPARTYSQRWGFQSRRTKLVDRIQISRKDVYKALDLS
jgi:hypothetical protein